MQQLNKAEEICRAAQKEDYTAMLAAREITAEYVTDLLDDTDAARTKAAEAIQHSTAGKTATAGEFKGRRTPFLPRCRRFKKPPNYNTRAPTALSSPIISWAKG